MGPRKFQIPFPEIKTKKSKVRGAWLFLLCFAEVRNSGGGVVFAFCALGLIYTYFCKKPLKIKK